MKKWFLFTLALLLTLSMASGSAQIKEITGSLPNDGRTVMYTIVLPEENAESYNFVVMNHGHGGGREEGGGFARLANALAEGGYASIRMDFAGTNQSPDPFTQNVLSLMISDSNACLNYVLENYPVNEDKLAILGYSMGGRMTMAILNEKDNPYDAGIMLAGSLDTGTNMMNNFFSGKEARENFEKEANGEKGFVEFTTQYGQVQQLSKEWFAEMHASTPLEDIKFSLPMLVIYGNQDTSVPPEIAKLAAEKLTAAGSTVQTLEIPEANHGYGFYSDQPEVTNALQQGVVDFLNSTFAE